MNLEELNYTLNIQNNNLNILLECLRNINSVIQNTDSFENPKELVELLKDTKINLDNTRNNISNLETLKKHSINLNNDETSSLDDYNELSKAYTEILNKTNASLNRYLLKYVQNTTFSVGTETSSAYTTASTETTNNVESTNIAQQEGVKTAEVTKATPAHTFTPITSQENTLQKEVEPETLERPSFITFNKNTHTETSTNNQATNSVSPTSEVSNSKNEIYNSVVEDATTNYDKSPEIKTNINDNVLLISEKKNKIVLPYTVDELNSILNTNNCYSSFQEIIDDEYTLPLNKFKNATISRFRETYNLMRKKEKSSIPESLDLALELTFYGKLNPAIIAACDSLEQLDTYLDCLESNCLDKFNYFEVKYEILPAKKYNKT